jgi:meso-butanediol dehydrogenase / (S,S)-butanediol dehydrogenase / diacetyl reductase
MVNINLNGKVAIVTGAGNGLGKAIALKFAEAGATVVVAGRTLSKLTDVSEQIKAMGVPSTTFQIDIEKPEQFTELVNTTVNTYGTLDIMVNNAGIGIMKPISDFTSDEINHVIDIDLKGTMFGTKAALNYMLTKESGKIVNMSSIAVKMATPASSVYSAAKAGVISFSNALAREVAEHNININTVCPGIVRTEMWEKQLAAMTGDGDETLKAQVFKSYTDMIPMKRPQEPDDIANMTLFLCSDLANNITAQTITVDGGATI